MVYIIAINDVLGMNISQAVLSHLCVLENSFLKQWHTLVRKKGEM